MSTEATSKEPQLPADNSEHVAESTEQSQIPEQPETSPASFSLQAFNQMVFKFLSDLKVVFKDDKKLRHIHKHFWTYVGKDEQAPKRWFDASLGQHGHLVRTKDAQIFELCPKVFHGLDIKSLWARCSAENREVVWSYLDWLHRYSTVLNAIPPGMGSQIDSAVKSMVQHLEAEGGMESLAGPSGQLDLSQVMGTAMRMFSGMT